MSGSRIILGAILSSYRPKVDGSFNITFSTTELDKEQKAIVDDLFRHAVIILIKDAEAGIDDSDEHVLNAVDVDIKQKTPSQRLRNVLFLLWKQSPQGFNTFSQYYEWKMERIIGALKDKLDT